VNFLKDKRRLLLIALIAMAVLLVGYGLLRGLAGIRLPDRLDRALPDLIMIAAVGIFVYGRKLAKEEKAKDQEPNEQPTALGPTDQGPSGGEGKGPDEERRG